jgi:CheY-like chemotaxis protein
MDMLPIFIDPAKCVDSEIDDVNRFGIWAISHLIPEIVTNTVNKFGQCRQTIRYPHLRTFRCEASMQSPLPQNERPRLESLRSFRILGTACEQVFDDIARLAAFICDTPFAVIAFIDEQRVWFKAKIGLELDGIPRDGSFCAYAILQSDVLIVQDPLSDERFMSSFLVKQIGIQFYAGIPLIAGDAPLGTLAVMDRVPHLLTAEQIDSLQILDRRIMHELELRQTREAQSPHKRLHLAPSREPSVTILLVEDTDNLRILLHRVLEGNGFSVLPAADGAEALRLCQQHDGTIDLVVSDIVMPQLNGLELEERIRAARPETKFLFITGFGDQFPELRERIKYGGNILEKPFLPSELLRKVEDTLNQGKAATGTEG